MFNYLSNKLHSVLIILIALRFLRSKRYSQSLSLITWISLLGILLGVTALIIVTSLMNGFRDNMYLALLGTSANTIVYRSDGQPVDPKLAEVLADYAGVVAVAPYFERQAFLSFGNRYRALTLRAINPSLESDVTAINHFLKSRLIFSEQDDPALLEELKEGTGIIIGSGIAKHLGVIKGETVTVISPNMRMTPIGSVPIMRTAKVVGFIETGFSNDDEAIAYMTQEAVAPLFRGMALDGFSVHTKDPQQRLNLSHDHRFDGFNIKHWSEASKNTLYVLALEKIGLTSLISLIIIVAMCNVTSSLIVLVLEKSRAIAILQTTGMSQRAIHRIFAFQGLWIGSIGTLGGAALGLLGCWVLGSFYIISLPRGVYPLADSLPIRIEPLEVLAIIALSFIVSAIATMIPASRSTRVNVIRNLEATL